MLCRSAVGRVPGNDLGWPLCAGEVSADKKEPAGQKSGMEHSRQREEAKSLRRSRSAVWLGGQCQAAGGARGEGTVQSAGKSGGAVSIYSKCSCQGSSGNEKNACILPSPSLFFDFWALLFRNKLDELSELEGRVGTPRCPLPAVAPISWLLWCTRGSSSRLCPFPSHLVRDAEAQASCLSVGGLRGAI